MAHEPTKLISEVIAEETILDGNLRLVERPLSPLKLPLS